MMPIDTLTDTQIIPNTSGAGFRVYWNVDGYDQCSIQAVLAEDAIVGFLEIQVSNDGADWMQAVVINNDGSKTDVPDIDTTDPTTYMPRFIPVGDVKYIGVYQPVALGGQFNLTIHAEPRGY